MDCECPLLEHAIKGPHMRSTPIFSVICLIVGSGAVLRAAEPAWAPRRILDDATYEARFHALPAADARFAASSYGMRVKEVIDGFSASRLGMQVDTMLTTCDGLPTLTMLPFSLHKNQERRLTFIDPQGKPGAITVPAGRIGVSLVSNWLATARTARPSRCSTSRAWPMPSA